MTFTMRSLDKNFGVEKTKIILASQSAARKAALRAAGIEFLCIVSDVDEAKVVDEDPSRRALERARAKCLATVGLIEKHADRVGDANIDRCLVIGSDQVLWAKGRFYSKVGSATDALTQLKSLRDQKVHELHTALWVVSLRKANDGIFKVEDSKAHTAVSSMEMRAASNEDLQKYVDTGEWEGCVGCYRFEGQGIKLFSSVEGDMNAITGLPMIALVRILNEAGVKLF